MKITEIVKNEKLLCFVGGVLAATYGVKGLKSEKAREICVNAVAKGMMLQRDAQEAIANIREEAEDICYDAEMKAFACAGAECTCGCEAHTDAE